MQFLLAGAVFILIALLGAKIFLDGKGSKVPLREHDPARAKRLTRELLTMTQGHTVHARVVDTTGRSALALVDGDRMMLVRATWSGDDNSKAPATCTLDCRVVESTELIDSRIRELSSSRTRKDGGAETRIGAVELLMFLDDLEAPVVVVDFLDKDAKPGSDEHEAARDEALRWEGMVRALVFRGHRQNQTKSQLQALQMKARSA